MTCVAKKLDAAKKMKREQANNLVNDVLRRHNDGAIAYRKANNRLILIWAAFGRARNKLGDCQCGECVASRVLAAIGGDR